MAPTGGERRPGPRATAAAGPIEARNGREVRGDPPLACADWSLGSIPGSDWSRRRSVWRGGGAAGAHSRPLRERVRSSAGSGAAAAWMGDGCGLRGGRDGAVSAFFGQK